MKKTVLVLLLATMSTVAMAVPPSKTYLAQCTLESYSDTGRRFLKENHSENDRDAAYRNWMLLCMEAKGFGYDPKVCPPAKNGALQASEGKCYEKL
jgi:hypothetical protein